MSLVLLFLLHIVPPPPFFFFFFLICLFRFTITEEGAYTGGCSDYVDNKVYIVYGGYNVRIDTLDPVTGVVTTGTKFTLPEQVADIKCDSVWHTVVLFTLAVGQMSASVYNVVPATGEFTLKSYYNSSDSQLWLSYGDQTYDSESHQFFFPNLYGEKPPGPTYIGDMIVFNLDTGDVSLYPWENQAFLFESPSAIPGGKTLIGNNMSFIRSFGDRNIKRSFRNPKPQAVDQFFTTLMVNDYNANTFTNIGPTDPLDGGVWGVGSVYDPASNQYYLFEDAPAAFSYLLTWDVTTGVRTQSQSFVLDPYIWMGYLTEA